ncbi:MAG: hypothetical protein NVS3B21_07510 [Acidimicrobiales bacterium]
MTGFIVIEGMAWLLLSLVGLTVIVLTPRRFQDLLLPAVPAVGACGLIAMLSLGGLVFPVRQLVPPIVFGCVSVLAIRGARHRIQFKRGAVGALLVVTLLGAVPVVIALQPDLAIGSPTMVEVGTGNDALAFISLSTWFEDHPVLSRPRIGATSPALGYVRTHQRLHARVGQDLVQASIALTAHRDPAAVWYPLTCLWLGLLPGAAFVAGNVLVRRRSVLTAASFVVAMSAIVMGQVFNQHSASVLGLALVPLALAGVISVVDRHRFAWPPWLCALFVVGLLGAYSEMLAVVAPGLATWLFARPFRTIRQTSSRLALLLICSLIEGPIVCFRAVVSLYNTFDGAFAPQVSTPFAGVSPATFVSRLTGAVTRIENEPDFVHGVSGLIVPVGIIVISALFLVAGGWTARRRTLWTGLSAASVGAVIYLGYVHPFAYGEQRAIEIGLPITLFAIGAGADGVIDAATRFGATLRVPTIPAPGRLLGVTAALSCAALSVPFVAANAATNFSSAYAPPGRARFIDKDLREASSWLDLVGGSDGSKALVVDADYFDVVWLAYLQRAHTRVSYPFFPQDASTAPPYALWDGRPRRWAVVGTSQFVSAPATAVKARNSRFELIDFDAGPVLLSVAASSFEPNEPFEGGAAHWMGNDGELILVGGCRSGTLIFGAVSQPALVPLQASFSVGGEPPVTAALTGGVSRVQVAAHPTPRLRVRIHNGRAARPTSGDPRRLSLRLTSVACAPDAGPGGDATPHR